MKKLEISSSGKRSFYLEKILLIMKLTTFLIFINLLQISAIGYSQNEKLSLQLNNATLKEMFAAIEKQTNYKFLYRDDVLEKQLVSINATEKPLDEILQNAFDNSSNTFRFLENNLIAIAPKQSFQQQKLTGTVTDGTTGEPVIGANVTIEGTTLGVVTDANGKFSMDIPKANAVVLVTYLGYNSDRVSVDGQSVLDIKLVPDIKKLDEVVVIGYGTTSKANLTTSIAKVSPGDVPGAANNSVNQLLFGRAAGLQVSTQSAEPGGNIELSVRGRKDPLIVLDGIVVSNNELEPTPGITELNGVKRGGLGNINPSDIESIEVLKDASAAIYGVSAGNGVILITTKKGKTGRMNVSYDASHSVVKNMPYLTPLNPKEYMTYYNIFSKDCYDVATPKFSDSDIQNAGAGTDWLGQVLRTGSIDNHSLNINGGTDKITYYFTGNYFNQEGTMKNSGLNRFSGKLNLSFVLNKFLKLNTNINASRNNYSNSTAGWQNGGSGSMGFGALQAALAYPTYLPLKDANGKNTQFVGIGNPISLLNISDKTNSSTLFSTFSLDIDLIPKMLSAKLLYGNTLDNASRNFYIPSDVLFGLIYQSRGAIATQQRQNQTMEATLAFKKSFANIIDLDAVAGYGQYIYDDNGSGMTATDMLDATGTSNMGAAPTRNSMTSYKNYEKKRSYFARANFGILDRYLVSLVYRADGIDKFFPENKYASFPSASVGWKISKESFMQNLTFVDLLKVRASIGITGLPVGTAAYGQYIADDNQAVFDNGATVYNPYYQTAIDQPNLKWEKTVNTNVGLDFGLFKNRISGSVDLFQDKVTNLLTKRSTDQLSYIGSAYDNGGSQVRSGYEIAFKSANIATKDFEWDMVVNLTHYLWRWDTRYSNQDLKAYEGIKDPVNAIYVFQTNGILKTGETPGALQPAQAKMEGAPKFVDRDGNDTINIKDAIMYNKDPKLILGVGSNFRYKNLDLGVFFYAQFGGKDFNNTLQWTNPKDIGGGGSSSTTDIKNVWSTVNENGNLPGGKFTESALGLPASLDTYVSSKDFVRCRNITLGYTFKSPAMAKYFNNLRVYVDVQNPFIITNYVGGDPEVQASATKGGPAPYPMARTYSVGVNVNF